MSPGFAVDPVPVKMEREREIWRVKKVMNHMLIIHVMIFPPYLPRDCLRMRPWDYPSL